MKWFSILLIMFCSVARADNPSPLETIRLVYSSTNVTTSAWTQLSAALPGYVREVQVFDSSGQVMELGLGAAGSEVAFNWVILPGGQDVMIPMMAATGQRLAIRAISGNATMGEIDLNLYF